MSLSAPTKDYFVITGYHSVWYQLPHGHWLRTQFDNLRPDMGKKVQKAQLRQAKGHNVCTKPREFNVGVRKEIQSKSKVATWRHSGEAGVYLIPCVTHRWTESEETH